MRQKLDAGILFSVFFTICFGYGVIEALSYDFLARIFPLYVSLILFAIALFNLGRELMHLKKRAPRMDSGKEENRVDDMPAEIVFKRLFFYIGIFLAIYAGIWIIGYPLSITISIILFYRFIARVGWFWSVVAGLAGFGFLVLAFSVMNMDWPEGLILLPWPLG